MDTKDMMPLAGLANHRFPSLAVGKSATQPAQNFEEVNSRLVVIGEINILQAMLRKIYPFLNDPDTYRPRILARSKSGPVFQTSHSSVSNSTQPEIDDDEDDFLEAINAGSISQDLQDANSLVQYLSLKRLKERLMKNLNVLIDDSYLRPFCKLIKRDISGHIIGLALNSLLKFLNYGLIDYTESYGSVQLISETIVGVRFNVTNSGNDEVVLMRILLLMREIITRGFTAIKNETITAMLKTCFKFLFETHFSELLRKTAEHSLVDMLRTIFMRLHEFEDKQIKQGVVQTKKKDKQKDSESEQNLIEPSDFVNTQGVKFTETSTPAISIVEPAVQTFYDIECIYDLLEYTCSLLAPSQKPDSAKNLEAKRQVGLNLLIVIFETAVLSIGEKLFLMQLVKRDLCWNLLQLVHQDRSMSIFLSALRLSTLLYTNLRMQLKYQFEQLLVRLIELICSNSVSYEYRETAIDYLFSLQQQIPFFAQEMYINYDCDVYSTNICEELTRLCSIVCCTAPPQTQHGEHHAFSPLQKTALNSLLTHLKSLQKAELTNNFSLHRYMDPEQRKKWNLRLQECSKTLEPQENDERERRKESTFLGSLDFPNTAKGLANLKERKRLLWQATEQFNAKPSKGIAFLQEHNLVKDDEDIVQFLRENVKLDKTGLGDFLSNRKNAFILEKFVKSFDFVGLRVDEALRLYLEAFRLPGESQLISNLLEHFSMHWYVTNDKPLAHEDSVFALSYAIIMLNTDLHNKNIRMQMNCDQFVHNLRGMDQGKDFDQDMLKDIFTTIKKDKFIMPAEMLGIVKDQYLWKCMLQRANTPHGLYWYAMENHPEQVYSTTSEPVGEPLALEASLCFDKQTNEYSSIDLSKHIDIHFFNESVFLLLWKPTLDSLTFLFDKIHMNQRTGLIKKILNQGFTSSAFLCSRYGHLDDLIAALCKFTVNSAGGPLNPLINSKSQDAAMCLFSIAKEHANEIKTSWINLVDLLFNWYRARFLEEVFEIEDFALGDKLVKMKRKILQNASQKNSSENSMNIFSSFYQFLSGSDFKQEQYEGEGFESPTTGTDREKDGRIRSNHLISLYSQPLYIIKDSKFFHIESLVALVNALIASVIHDDEEDDIEAFRLELIIQIVLLNRDRVTSFWPAIINYLQKVLHICKSSNLLLERIVSALFRLAIRFTPRQDGLSEQIFLLLSNFLKMNPKLVQKYHTAFGLHSFIAHCHSYLNKSADWALVNDLLLFVGIGYRKRQFEHMEGGSIEILNIQSDGDSPQDVPITSRRGYTSDSEMETRSIVVPQNVSNPYELLSGKSVGLGRHSGFKIRDIEAYEKCIDSLAVLSSKLIPRFAQESQTPELSTEIIDLCVQAMRKYAEASIRLETGVHRSAAYMDARRRHAGRKFGMAGSAFDLHALNDSASEPEENLSGDHEQQAERHEQTARRAHLADATESGAIRILQLMHELQLCVEGQRDESTEIPDSMTTLKSVDQVWTELWCPLLQANALLCCDARKTVRTSAVAYLQRALLNRDLQKLQASQWENCFNRVLFPLLERLLQPINLRDPAGMDETRVRVTNLLCKLFLQHLNALHSLPTFTALWLTLLDYMNRYLHADLQGELMREAIPESLKNMLLVMHTAKCLEEPLYSITWDRINLFLPSLREEIFPTSVPVQPVATQATITQSSNFSVQSSIPHGTTYSQTQSAQTYVQTPSPPQLQSLGNESYVQQAPFEGAVNSVSTVEHISVISTQSDVQSQQTALCTQQSPVHAASLEHAEGYRQSPQTSPVHYPRNTPSHQYKMNEMYANHTFSSVSIGQYHHGMQYTPQPYMMHSLPHQTNPGCKQQMPLSPSVPGGNRASPLHTNYSPEYCTQYNIAEHQPQSIETGTHATMHQMPTIHNNLQIPEQMYQHLQQQRQYDTNKNTNMQPSNAYPWPSPGDAKYF